MKKALYELNQISTQEMHSSFTIYVYFLVLFSSESRLWYALCLTSTTTASKHTMQFPVRATATLTGHHVGETLAVC